MGFSKSLAILATFLPAWAESGHEAWLRYRSIETPNAYSTLPATVATFGKSPVITSSKEELLRGVRGMLGKVLRAETQLPNESAIVIGALPDLPFPLEAELKPGSFWITTKIIQGKKRLILTGADDRGVLYGTFALLRRMSLRQPVMDIDDKQQPHAPIRWLNHWDNLDGTIERGYGGRSIFFENNNVRADLEPVRDYARMLASLGINACSINNVNANPRVITPEFLPQLKRIAEVFRAWGVQLAVSIDFSSPQKIGGLKTFDPLDPDVIEFWRKTVDNVYEAVPDLGGFVLKADSEGRLGPSAYNRSHADAANVIARPLKAHGGLLFYRGFVYDHHMDWRNLKNDRARAAYDNFVALDGKFENNAIVQIKHGPIDFQVREPASPLFGALKNTNQAIELQITQEYFGQGRHLVFLIPMWKEALNFDLQAKGPGTPVKALVDGFVGVSNVGLDPNWMGHHLSQANLYGFGRLAWNPDLTSTQIAEEWTRLTFSNDPQLVKTITTMQVESWKNFENYTGPLGAQTLTEITGNHYGPAVEASERNGWGQWHRADEKGIGMDRTVATGTGYIGQYSPPVAKIYESLQSCPDELLLFMHHVPYTHVLHSGKTVIQHIYDTHYAGAEAAAGYVKQWRSLERKIDEQRYQETLAKLEYQASHAEVWRDSVNTWFWKTSGIPDKQNRVGGWPGRVEAEALQLEGYEIVNVKPWETASGAKAISCGNSDMCKATLRYTGKPGWYRIRVQYFDQNNGVSHYRLLVNSQPMDHWQAAETIPTRKPDGHSSTRKTTQAIALRTGDEITIEGTPDNGEKAALDYLEIQPI